MQQNLPSAGVQPPVVALCRWHIFRAATVPSRRLCAGNDRLRLRGLSLRAHNGLSWGRNRPLCVRNPFSAVRNDLLCVRNRSKLAGDNVRRLKSNSPPLTPANALNGFAGW